MLKNNIFCVCFVGRVVLFIYFESKMTKHKNSYYMKKLLSVMLLSMGVFLFSCQSGGNRQKTVCEEIAPGVLKLQTGVADPFTPYSVFGGNPSVEAMEKLPEAELPFSIDDILLEVTDRGCLITVPLSDDEQIYGFGMQYGTFGQRGLRRRPIVNDNPLNDLGYSHAPQTFYVSTKGYGILVNTARYTTFLCGSNTKISQDASSTEGTGKIANDPSQLYNNRAGGSQMFIDVPGAKGIEVFVLTGPQLKDVVQRYNLLSGGGCMPPLWGLGFKYRVKGDATQDSVYRFARYFRQNNVPCDMLGLEPGWQTAAYSCSYVWSKDRFPNHKAMLDSLRGNGFKIDLWEHAYVHPSSPIRKELEPYSGDFLVWNGLVPDFLLPEARKIFGDYHQTLIDEGISGFKLDECDNSNIAFGSATWCFPDLARFPSGVDGEQMHQMFGSLYVRLIDDLYRKMNLRGYQNYRSSGTFMSSCGAVLYSDTYKHKDYIQAICNSAFGGLLWCPEVREAGSVDDLFHRLQTVILSPLAMVNAWYLQHAPWLQFDRYKNERGEFLPQAKEYEADARKLIEMRMQLVPYLYRAFYAYHAEGIPPFRPLVMDFPDDKRVRDISDQYMVGDGLMAAPLYQNGDTRKVYFPEGTWYNFNTHEKYEGGKEYEVKVLFDQLPLFVRQGTLLPLAEPVQCITGDTSFKLHCKVFGAQEASCTLFEDDGTSYDFEKGAFNMVTLKAAGGKVELTRTNGCDLARYEVADWEFID